MSPSAEKPAPLCEPDYLVPPEKLPPSQAPAWMRLGLIATLAAAGLAAAATLLGPMDETVPATGVVRASSQHVVHSRVAAIMKDVAVKPGDRVEAGALLVRLDPWEFEKRLARLDAESNEARAALRLAEATQAKIAAVPAPEEFLFSEVEQLRQREITRIRKENTERLEKLQEKGAASLLDVARERLQLIDAEAALDRSGQAKALLAGPYGAAALREAEERRAAAQARVESLEAERRLVQAERERCDVVAPAAGRVLAVTTRLPGEPVAAGAPLVRLAAGEEQELRLYATEDRLGLIVPGQSVRFQLKRQADKLARPARAEVDEVALDRDMADQPATGSAAEVDESYRITARVLSSDEPLPMGAEVEAEIIIRRESFWRLMLRRSASETSK